MRQLTLEILRADLSKLFHFDIDLKKSLNVDYNMDGEEVADAIDIVAKQYDLDWETIDKAFSYTLHFKQGVIHPIKTEIRRLFGLSHDENYFKEIVPLYVKDIFAIMQKARKE